MTRSMQGQVAWITGGGTGLGAAIARELGRRGATVVVSGRRKEPLLAVVSDIQGARGQAEAEPCDVTVDAQVQAVVHTILDRHGRLDWVVACAGYAATGAVEALDARAWKHQLDANVLGTVSTARHALPALRESRGHLVLVGSVVAFLGLPKNGAYAASKAAIASLGRTLANEVGPDGVQVTTVHPGFVESEIAQVDAHGRRDPSRKDRRPRWLMWRADRAARVIVDAARRGERTYVFTGHGRLAAAVGRHLPELADRLVRPKARPTGREGGPEDAVGAMTIAFRPTVPLTADPGTLTTFIGGVLAARGRPQGRVDGPAFPGLAVRLPGVVVAPDRVQAYRRACAVPGPATVLPPAMPEILFLGLMGWIARHPEFPLSPFGLIHTGQTLTMHRPLPTGEPLDLAARVQAATRTPKGVQLEVALTADLHGDRVWEGVVTFLSRNDRTQRVRRRDRAPEQAPPAGGIPIEAPADAGRAYAAVSGDYNPHHLWPATARPLGYPRPIAHGMWTLARVLALAPEEALAAPLHVDVRFKRPLFLPGLMHADVSPDPSQAGRWTLSAYNPRSGAPHLVGTLTRGR